MSLSTQHVILAGTLVATLMATPRLRRLVDRKVTPRPGTLRRRRRAVAEAAIAARTLDAPAGLGPHLKRRPLADRGERHPDTPHPMQVALVAVFHAFQAGIFCGALLWTRWPGPWAIVLGVATGITVGWLVIWAERRRRERRRVPKDVVDAF